MFKLSKRSLNNLEGVHPLLVNVTKRAIEITKIDFAVTEGLRTKERQKHLFSIGASKTMNSKHLIGRAVDLVAYDDGIVSWSWPLYHVLRDAMFEAAFELDANVEWGGDWKSFPDGPHFQLSDDE